MIVQAADRVDLDPGCVLYGAIELTPLDTWQIAGWDIPRVVVISSGVLLVNLLFVVLLHKELTISAFDPALATSEGFSARIMHYGLMTLVAVTAVASFETVGNILVVAMFVVPPASAHLLTDRLPTMIVLSALLAAAAAVLGHISAIVVPTWFGFHSTSTAGMMAVAAGVLFAFAVLFAPRHGVLAKLFRRRLLAWKILEEDVLALLYRLEERQPDVQAGVEQIRDVLLSDARSTRFVLWSQQQRGLISGDGVGYRLTPAGRDRARELVRTHRLWEQYLVAHAGLPAERIHPSAERLEHFTTPQLRERLDAETDSPTVDPHGSEIPTEVDRTDP